MSMRGRGFTRRDIRGGSGAEAAGEHFDEMIGTVELYVYRHPSRKIKGYGALKSALEAGGCRVELAAGGDSPVGKGYETIRVTNGGAEIPVPLLRQAHNWAHRRNFLHMFYKRGA